MNLSETIFKRKSTRKYDPSPLDNNVLADIQTFIKGVKPLYDDIKVQFGILPAEKVKASTNAPHFIMAYSEEKDGGWTNTGFMLQQVDLYIQSIGLGSCWLGMAKPLESGGNGLGYVISMAFGKPEGSPYRELSGFKRKPLEKVSDTVDKRLEPARLAPSAINSQPWYFVTTGEGFDCYCAKKFPAALYGKLNKIDMGIALTHLYVTYQDKFRFSVQGKAKQVKGHYYFGSVGI
jgi:nitroreductase